MAAINLPIDWVYAVEAEWRQIIWVKELPGKSKVNAMLIKETIEKQQAIRIVKNTKKVRKKRYSYKNTGMPH